MSQMLLLRSSSHHFHTLEFKGLFSVPKIFLLVLCLSAPIFRFMPRVEIVQKHNTAARRLYIRGHNGKIYPYLVMNDACLTESRREERVLQLLRLLNPCLEKRKETTKRHLFFTGRTRDQNGTRDIIIVVLFFISFLVPHGFFFFKSRN